MAPSAGPSWPEDDSNLDPTDVPDDELDLLGSGSSWPQSPDGSPWTVGATTDSDGWPHPPIFPEDVNDIRALGLDNWSRLYRLIHLPTSPDDMDDGDMALGAFDSETADAPAASDEPSAPPLDPPPAPSLAASAQPVTPFESVDPAATVSSPAGIALDPQLAYQATARRPGQSARPAPQAQAPYPPYPELFRPYDPEADPNRVHHALDARPPSRPTPSETFNRLAQQGFPLPTHFDPYAQHAGHDENADWYAERPAAEQHWADQVDDTGAMLATAVAGALGADEEDQIKAADLGEGLEGALLGAGGLRGAPPDAPGVAAPDLPGAPAPDFDGAKPRPTSPIYVREDLSGALAPYGGQSVSMQRYGARQQEHRRAYPDANFHFGIADWAEPGIRQDIAEHQFIQWMTRNRKASRSSAVSNQRDPMGPRRRPLYGMPDPKD